PLQLPGDAVLRGGRGGPGSAAGELRPGAKLQPASGRAAAKLSATGEPELGLAHLEHPLEGGDPLVDRGTRVEKAVEPVLVVLERAVDVHRRRGVIELLERLVPPR